MRRLKPTDILTTTSDHKGESSLEFVSIVVPVRNEQRYIKATLEMLLRQEYPEEGFEILVVDGRSDDATRDIVKRIARIHTNVRLVDNPRIWSSAGRNVGVEHARGDIILVIDGHCELESTTHLRDLVDAFTRSGADIVGRPQPLRVANASKLQRAISEARASLLGHHPDSFIYTQVDRFVPAISVGAAYRRNVFDVIGFFDETFDACEDVDFNHRADQAELKCFFSSKVAVCYAPRSSLTGLFHQLARYGRGRIRLGRKHPETFTLKTLLPGVFVTGILAGPILPWIDTRLVWVYWLCLLFYVGVLIGASLSIAFRRRDWKLAFILPLVFATIHISAGFGILQETLLGGLKSWWSRPAARTHRTMAVDRSDRI